MKTAALLLAMVLLAGCSSLRGNTAAARDSWRGATYDEVAARWGAPVRTADVGDGRVARTWVSETQSARGALLPSIGIYGGSDGVGVGTGIIVVPGGYELLRCERTLVFSNERVADQTWHGPADYCASFRRN